MSSLQNWFAQNMGYVGLAAFIAVVGLVIAAMTVDTGRKVGAQDLERSRVDLLPSSLERAARRIASRLDHADATRDGGGSSDSGQRDPWRDDHRSARFGRYRARSFEHVLHRRPEEADRQLARGSGMDDHLRQQCRILARQGDTPILGAVSCDFREHQSARADLCGRDRRVEQEPHANHARCYDLTIGNKVVHGGGPRSASCF